MPRTLSATEAAALPSDVIVSVEEVTRALPPPVKALPRWLARILPKTGLAGRAGEDPSDLLLDDDDEDELDDDEGDEEESAALSALSFQVRAGDGMGVLCDDRQVLITLVRILIGAIPPSTGRVLVRGRVAPVTHREITRLVGNTEGRKSVDVVAKYFHWPLGLIHSRWDEIEEFAAVDELERMRAGKRRRLTSTRLSLSAALHMDATAYVVDQSIHYDPSFGVRLLDKLAERQAEGAAVVQTARRIIEDVVRLCPQHVMWLEDGKKVYSGTPVHVAKEVHRNTTEKVLDHHIPITASLVDDAHLVELHAGGSHVDFEVHAVRPSLEVGFALELTDGHGKVFELRTPERLEALDPGIYRLRVTLPPGRLEPGSQRARLIAEIAIVGNEPAPPRELLAFDVSVSPGAGDGVEAPEGFDFHPVSDDELPSAEAG